MCAYKWFLVSPAADIHVRKTLNNSTMLLLNVTSGRVNQDVARRDSVVFTSAAQLNISFFRVIIMARHIDLDSSDLRADRALLTPTKNTGSLLT